MANKWKYSTLTASERTNRIASGDKDVYDAEIGRSLSVIKDREALGLDTTEQKKWIDDISYAYNTYNASKMGISSESVNKTGYADRLLGNTSKAAKTHVKTVKKTVNEETYKTLRAYREELMEKVREAEEQRAVLEEWLDNNGIALDGGEGQKYLADFGKETEEKIQTYYREYEEKAKKLGFR